MSPPPDITRSIANLGKGELYTFQCGNSVFCREPAGFRDFRVCLSEAAGAVFGDGVIGCQVGDEKGAKAAAQSSESGP